MASAEKTREAIEEVAETVQGSAQAVVDQAVGIQERNVKFAQGMVDSYIEELRHQGEQGRETVQKMVEQSEKQRESFQKLADEWVSAYMDAVYSPFSYYKEGLEAMKKASS
jgi:methyl-accepting chemotaxis protein